MSEKHENPAPGILWASGFLVVLAVVLIVSNLIFSMPVQLSLLLAMALCCIFAGCLGYRWKSIEEMIVHGLSAGMFAMLINSLIGILIAVLCASGTMPYLMCMGLRFVSPRFFLTSVFVICSLFSSCTGSSYTTAGTIGAALMGLGAAVGEAPAVTAGTILCGCYFGEKLSPISEAVNVSSACAGASPALHIRAMQKAIFPAAGVTAAICLAFDSFAGRSLEQSVSKLYEQEFSALFQMSPILILPIVIMMLMIFSGKPALVTLAAGITAGSLICVMYQEMPFTELADTFLNGCTVHSQNLEITRILSRGGLNSMSGIIFVMIFGMPMGGILKETRILETIISHVSKSVKSIPGLVAASSICSMLSAAMTGSNYPAYLLTVSAFSERYDSLGLDRSMLSRSCEMAGFCGAVLPWTTTGVFMASVLGVSPLSYAPYYFFGFLVPICTIVCSCSGWGNFYIRVDHKGDDIEKNEE